MESRAGAVLIDYLARLCSRLQKQALVSIIFTHNNAVSRGNARSLLPPKAILALSVFQKGAWLWYGRRVVRVILWSLSFLILRFETEGARGNESIDAIVRPLSNGSDLWNVPQCSATNRQPVLSQRDYMSSNILSQCHVAYE